MLVVCSLLVATVTLPATPARSAGDPCAGHPRAAFTDVDDGDVHAPGIDCLVWHEITQGVSFDRFAPDSTLRRDEFASLLLRTLSLLGTELPSPERDQFDDVRGTHADAVSRLAEVGVVQGTAPRSFSPHAPVRRDQLATVLVRAHRLATENAPTTRNHDFEDVAGNPHEHLIAEAASLGLLHGVTSRRYEPHRLSSRAQAASVLGQLLEVASDHAVATFADDGTPARIQPVPTDLRRLMQRTTWEPDCPVGPDQLRLLHVVHHDFAGAERWGLLVVHEDVVTDVATAFLGLHERGFPIARMQPVERFGGDDGASMAANNTSGFNCRPVTGGSGWSAHSYGWAIDINPVQNPYRRGELVLPSAGRGYLERDEIRPGMLTRPGAVEEFDELGWGWGGDWSSPRDYQHVSRSHR